MANRQCRRCSIVTLSATLFNQLPLATARPPHTLSPPRGAHITPHFCRFPPTTMHTVTLHLPLVLLQSSPQVPQARNVPQGCRLRSSVGAADDAELLLTGSVEVARLKTPIELSFLSHQAASLKITLDMASLRGDSIKYCVCQSLRYFLPFTYLSILCLTYPSLAANVNPRSLRRNFCPRQLR